MALSKIEKLQLLRGLLEQLPEDKLLEFIERMQETIPKPSLIIDPHTEWDDTPIWNMSFRRRHEFEGVILYCTTYGG